LAKVTALIRPLANQDRAMPLTLSTIVPSAQTLKNQLWLTLTAALLLAALYKLFEPLWLWPFGWQPMPALLTDAGTEKLYQLRWRKPADAARILMQQAQQQTGAPAVSIAVGIKGELVWAYAIGYADVANKTAVSLDSRFRIGSTAKAVTAMAAGTLLQQGKLDLDAPVQHYVPDFPTKPYPITTRHVMSHMAGIRNYQLCLCFPVWENLSTSAFSDLRASLKMFEDDDLLFAPGSAFSYTSYGYTITGAVIEGASGQNFLNYLDQAVLQPLGMQHTVADQLEQAMPERVQFYNVEGSQYKLAWPVDSSNKWPSGGLVSTPQDLVRLGNAVLSGRLLDTATMATLLTPQKLDNGEVNPQSYALGWRHSPDWKVLDQSRETHAYHHGGLATGSTSVFILYPEFGLSLSLMMNKGTEDYGELRQHADIIADTFIRALLN